MPMLDETFFKKIYSLEIPQFITKVELSKARRPKYYSLKSGRGRVTKIPNKLATKNFIYDLEGFLIDEKQQRIIANMRSAGTPKYVSINSQILYSQNGGQFTRTKIVNTLHAYLKPFVSKLKSLKNHTPLLIHLNWHLPYQYRLQDNTNLAYIWMKVFEDELVTQLKLPDDEVKFVSGALTTYTPCETFEDRKLIFTFWKDLRPELLQLKLL